MDELSNLLIDGAAVELWIFNQIQKNKSLPVIADELVQRWEKGLFDLSAKRNAGRFCLLAGYFSPVTDQILIDLKKGNALPWDIVMELICFIKVEPEKTLVDALMSGATRDKALAKISAVARQRSLTDPRWEKIWKSECHDFEKLTQKKRRGLFDEARIFKNEGMYKEMGDVLQKIFALVPHDTEALELFKTLKEKEMDAAVARVKSAFERRSHPRLENKNTESWDNLSQQVQAITPTLSKQLSVELAFGLFQMGLNQDALNTLHVHKEAWSVSDKFLEIQILLELGRYAEALETSQTLIRECKDNADDLNSALYFSAKAYYGLEDLEQAIGILKALTNHKPDFRDSSILLTHWQQEAGFEKT